MPLSVFSLFLMIRPPPRPTLFPYTTLFRSIRQSRVFLRLIGGYARRTRNPRLREVPQRLEITQGRFASLRQPQDRKSTRLNSSHRCISYAVFCLKKKKKEKTIFNNICYNIK